MTFLDNLKYRFQQMQTSGDRRQAIADNAQNWINQYQNGLQRIQVAQPNVNQWVNSFQAPARPMGYSPSVHYGLQNQGINYGSGLLNMQSNQGGK